MKSVTVVQTGSLKAANAADRGRLEVRDIPEPVLGDEQVKIKVAYCAICGSDPHLLQNQVLQLLGRK